jgi:hypothetical protein
MPKRPYFPFYPADWRGNTKLKFASPPQKSAWLEFMCLAHDSDEYGVLRQELKRIAGAIPCHQNVLQSLADQDILKGVHAGQVFAGFVYRDRNGIDHTLIPPCEGPIWFSSRMVVDEHLRRVASAAGKRGGNPTLKGAVKPHPKPSITASVAEEQQPRARGGGNGRAHEPDELDVQIRHFIGRHPMLEYHARNHAKLLRIVQATDWDFAERMIQKGIEERAAGRVKVDPIDYAAGAARKEAEQRMRDEAAVAGPAPQSMRHCT